jgi:hypothetical protein
MIQIRMIETLNEMAAVQGERVGKLINIGEVVYWSTDVLEHIHSRR